MNANEVSVGRARESAAVLRGLVERADAVLSGIQGRAGTAETVSEAVTALDQIEVRVRRILGELAQVDPSLFALSEFEQHVSANLEIARAMNGAVDLAAKAREARTRLRAVAGATKEDIVYIARDGETLQRIAQRFYGSANRWLAISERNGLRDPTVQAGLALIIPGVAPGQDAS